MVKQMSCFWHCVAGHSAHLYRYIEAAVYMGKRKEKPAFSSHRKMVKLAVQNNCHAVKTFVSRSGSDRSDKSSTRDKIPDGSSPSAESSDAEEDESGSSQDIDGIFSSSRWGSWKKFGSFRKYEADVVGRLSDLVAEGQGGKKSLSLQVECLRPFDSVVTTVSERISFFWWGDNSRFDIVITSYGICDNF